VAITYSCQERPGGSPIRYLFRIFRTRSDLPNRQSDIQCSRAIRIVRWRIACGHAVDYLENQRCGGPWWSHRWQKCAVNLLARGSTSWIGARDERHEAGGLGQLSGPCFRNPQKLMGHCSPTQQGLALQPVETIVGTQDRGGDSYRVDLFVRPERNPTEPDGPLIWKGNATSPMGFVVRARSLPELVTTAERHARELGATGQANLRIYLIPDKVPPEPVVELRISGLMESPE
jgi:hypothetical protein